MEAVRTCAALLIPNLLPPTIFSVPFINFSAASAQVVGDVLSKLLTVGITDPGTGSGEGCIYELKGQANIVLIWRLLPLCLATHSGGRTWVGNVC